MAVTPSPVPTPARVRPDRCPGVLRPWPADDGALLRVRLVGGRLSTAQLAGLAALSQEHGDGDLHLTSRGNLQLRSVPLPVPLEIVERVRALGLLPSNAHERVRNVLVSPLSGRTGGRADLREVAERYDALLCADPVLAGLPARFLVCLDDRGDLADRSADLALEAVETTRGRVRAGGWLGATVPLTEAPDLLVALARRFVELRGGGPTAPWHVTELPGGPADLGRFTAPGVPASTTVPPPYGRIRQDDGRTLLHLAVPDGVLGHALTARVLTEARDEVVVTPWRGVVLPDLAGGPC
jgi:precorrin-3B synthase